MSVARKITVEVPDDLMRRAQESTGEGFTATVRRGLELVAAASTFDELRDLRGGVEVSLDLEELRKDRA